MTDRQIQEAIDALRNTNRFLAPDKSLVEFVTNVLTRYATARRLHSIAAAHRDALTGRLQFSNINGGQGYTLEGIASRAALEELLATAGQDALEAMSEEEEESEDAKECTE